MKLRLVVVLAIILMVIGIVITCFDYAKTTPNSNEAETQPTVSDVSAEEKDPIVDESQTTDTGEETQATEKQEDESESTETSNPTQETGKQESDVSEDPKDTEPPKTESTEETQPPVTEDDNPSEYFGKDITFKSDYVRDNGVMPYALYTPTTIDANKEMPLIVWLHGSGEVGVSEETFFNSGLLKTLNKWRRQGFNAYVICPQLAGNYNTGRWNKEATRDNLKALLDKFIKEHNVDTDRIIVVGHSLGGQGALYMAHELPKYFSRCVVLSGYNPGIDITEIKIPTLGFVGLESAGEDGGSVSYMKKYFMETFGDKNTFFIETSHSGVPNAAFSIDTDDDDRSDLVEWMFGEFEF